MTLAALAASSDTAGGRLLILVGLLVAAGSYLASCRLWPYARCRTCEGTGRNAGSNSKRWGSCRRCKGGGRRERFGVRMVYKKR